MNDEHAQKSDDRGESILQRLVSVFRSTAACWIYHFLVFVSLWTLFGKLAEGSGFIKFHGWWMCYGYFVGQGAWWAADKVKSATSRAH